MSPNSLILSRRRLLAGAAATTGLALAAPVVRAQPARHRVVILGGGIGGTTAAKYIALTNPGVSVTLIDRDRTYYTCPRSNDVIVGVHDMRTITFTHDAVMSRYGVTGVFGEIVGVDRDRRQVAMADGTRVPYDRLIVSPGVDLVYDSVWGYSEEVADTVMPHGWHAGRQTELLRDQLKAVPQGGRVIIVAPPNPYRCPPGPYERASMMAEWMQHHNPTGKVLILDPKNAFTKDGPFKAGWERLYGFGTDKAVLEWIPAAEGGLVSAVEPGTMTVEAAGGRIRGDLVNVIPAMRAGRLAGTLGLTNGDGWCPVDQSTFRSDLAEDTHVIGDACIAGAMPKSGYAANSQAKLVAHVIRAELAGEPLPVPTFANACYSLVGESYGVSIASIYEVDPAGEIVNVAGSGGVSPVDDAPNRPVLEAVYQKNWHRTFAADVFS
ncbi:NAD(P)/FAD-dependent oxidoreductase [Roseospira navarrensis]|uniref:Flavocytochrome c sulfide dehydrogenase flavin-binding protein n=1 Tax=Roseospira navarrensis TaxID=140058 RepID=A0A7X2D602_9PROT|nr:NAD(P)/FAD-dependent oxidoreductase [Roseospira navarrensis]MQX37795.1 flavocytochrome c sulfide dehydrogenase flavin-binding protein [Roseospira navarrensis]